MKTLIVPMCGKSTRFPGMKPKWLLTHPCGLPMWQVAISDMMHHFDRVILVVLNEHLLKYEPNLHTDPKIEVCVINEQTINQPETVAKCIEYMGVKGSFVVKDADNYFRVLQMPDNNFVGYCDITNTKNPAGKSYLTRTIYGDLLNIVEKQVVSQEFCVGLYGFADADAFLKTFSLYQDEPDLYLSHIIYSMLIKQTDHPPHPFTCIPVFGFLDWGTLEDWKEFTGQFATYFCDIDGTLIWSAFESNPPYKEGGPITDNIKALNAKYDAGSYVVLTTARPEAAREFTEKQLKSYGVKYHQLVMGLAHCKRIVINDFATSNPYPSCSAINLPRNSQNLQDLI